MSGLRIGSLFSGIGGLELGLERAGLGHVVWQVESDPDRRDVLKKHWPDVLRFADVTKFDGLGADVLCGGFPCQGISSANVSTRAGLLNPDSGLWFEYERIVGNIRPSWVIVENSPEWRYWMPIVRAGLARLGYASMPLVLSAGYLGAPHSRPRGFVVANSDGHGESVRAFHAEASRLLATPGVVRDWGEAPPGGFRMDDGVPGGARELAAYGNACVPQVAEVIGRAIVAAIGAELAAAFGKEHAGRVWGCAEWDAVVAALAAYREARGL